jgi:HEAT repeat protein
MRVNTLTLTSGAARMDAAHGSALRSADSAARGIGSERMNPTVLVLMAILAIGRSQEPDALSAALAEDVDDSIVELKSPDPGIRQRAALMLGLAGKGAEKAVPDLLVVLKDPVPRVRAFAALALGEIGPKLVPVRKALETALLSDSEGEVRSSAAASLGKCASPASVEALVKALRDVDARTRLESLRALEAIESPGLREASAVIRALAEDPDPDIKSAAKALLKKLHVD